MNRFTSIALVIALVLTLGGTSAFARTPSDPPAKADGTKTPALPAGTKETKSPEKLKADMLTLVAAAKAGKVTPRPAPQFPSGQGNNLSKGWKIAIVAGIALVIVAAIIAHKISNAGCTNRCVL